jgi:hypothetical protein
LPVVAMFVNRSGQNDQSLERTFHRCFLLSSSSFGWEVSEEKIKMRKVNERQTTDAKWRQKLTLPLARWAENENSKVTTQQYPMIIHSQFGFLMKKCWGQLNVIFL